MHRSPAEALAHDWQRLLSSPHLAARFGLWQVKQPELARFTDAAALIRFMRDRHSRAEKDAVLRALLLWAKQEPIGARVVLETIRPGLVNLSVRIVRVDRERDEMWATMLLAVWEGIRSYPLARRPRRVAANLLLDAMHGALVELGHESAWRAAQAHGSPECKHDAPLEIDSDVDGLFARAVGASAVSAAEAELVLATRIDGIALAELARDAGVSYNTMKLRRQRAERRLLLFLGYRPVPRGRQNRPSSLARVAGIGSQGPVGEK
jgi:DNA-directed RNA polymerase specialized sigma24 family protein